MAKQMRALRHWASATALRAGERFAETASLLPRLLGNEGRLLAPSPIERVGEDPAHHGLSPSASPLRPMALAVEIMAICL